MATASKVPITPIDKFPCAAIWKLKDGKELPVTVEGMIDDDHARINDAKTPVPFTALWHPSTGRQSKKIDAAAIRRDINKPNQTEPATHSAIFDAILKDLPENKDIKTSTNFFTKEAKSAPGNITQRDYVVVTVDQVIKAARKAKVGVCYANGFIYLYNGEFWKQCEREELKAFLGKAAERLGVPMTMARYCKTCDTLLQQFHTAAYMPKPEVDKDKILLNFKNGTYEITKGKGKLRAFNQKDFLTYQLPFDYDPTANAPIWEKYLDRVLPAEDKKDTLNTKARQLILAEFIAWCFTDIKLEKVLFLYGEGANGKSVFFEVVSALLGDENVTHYSIASLSDSKGYERARIADSLLNYASEVGVKVDAEYLKKLASREPVEARLPFEPPFLLRRYARLAFNANELPRDAEHSTAFFRRFLIVPFTETIPPEERNKNLHKEIIQAELSGVFNWVMAGLARLVKQGDFSPCDVAEKAQEQFQYESDSVAVFLDEENYKKPQGNQQGTRLSALYASYRTFTKENGYLPLSCIKFSKRLKKLGFESEKKTYGKEVNIVKTAFP